MPAITAQQRSDLVLLVNGVFGAAPTSRVLSNLVKLVEEGNSVDQVATMLTNNSNFESIYAPALLNSEFATQFAGNLLGAAATTETTARVEALVTTYLTAGDSRTEAVWKVTKLLSTTEDAAFATAKAQLNNKADVSLTFALDTSYTELMTLEQLQSVIANVTSDEATVTAAKTAIANGTAVSGVNTGETFTLTTGVDTLVGTGRNDTFNASDLAGGTNNNVQTFATLDSIDGGNGLDTFNLADQNNAINVAGSNVSNVETVNIAGAAAVTANTTNWAGTQTVNLTQAGGNVALTAAATTDVNVSNAAALTSVTNGKTVTVSQDLSASVSDGDTNANETITEVTVNGAQNVVVTGTNSVSNALDTANNNANDDVDGGINVSNTVGTVDITTTGQNVNVAGGSNGAYTMDAITVSGGTAINVTQNANSVSGDAATAANANTAVTQGAVTVTGGNTTTTVNVKQDDQVTAVAATAAAGTNQTQVVTFSALTAGQSATVNGLTFTATKDLTAAEVAQAFANLTNGDRQDDGGPVVNGTYTGSNSTLAYTSGTANGATVTYTAVTQAANTAALAVSGTGVSVAAGVAGVAAQAAATGVAGVNNGAVIIDDNATKSITTVTVDGYAAGATLGNGGSLDALTSLTLKNSGTGTAAVTTGSTGALALTLDDVDGTVNLDAGTATLTALTINTEGTASTGAVVADAATSVTINAAANLSLSATSSLDAATSFDVNGTGAVTLNGIDNSTVLQTIDASDNTGGVTVVLGSNNDVAFTGGAGNDSLTLATSTILAGDNVAMGAGDDTVYLQNIANSSNIAAGVTISGGEGAGDIIRLDASNAAALSGSNAFEGKIDGFEKLQLDAVQNNDGALTVNLDNVDDISYVISANAPSIGGATTESAVVTFQALSAGQSVTIAGATVTAAADLTAAQVEAAFLAGQTTGNATYTGTLTGWTVAENGTSTDGVLTFTSTTANTNVTDLTATTAGTTESSVVTFGSMVAGETVTVNGLTLTATAFTEVANVAFTDVVTPGSNTDQTISINGVTVTLADAGSAVTYTAAEIAAAFATGSTTTAGGGTITVSGSYGLYSAAAGAGTSVDFTSLVANTNVTDLTVTGSAAANATVSITTQGNNGQLTAAQVAEAFDGDADGLSTSTSAVQAAVMTGTQGSTFTPAAIASGNSVTYTAATANSNVTDISVTGASVSTTQGVAAPSAPSISTTQGVASGANDTLTLTNMANNGTLELNAAGAGVTVTMTDATGGADAFNIVLDDSVTASGIAAGTVTTAGVETINVSVDDTFADTNNDGKDDTNSANSLTLSDATTTTVNVSGAGDLTLTATGANVKTVDASAATGIFTYSATTANMTVTGGSANDVISVTAAADNATLNGGAGNDTFNIAGGADQVVIDGGAGNDTFVFNGVASTDSLYTVINNIASGDTVQFNMASITSFNSQAVTLASGATESTQAYQDAAMAAIGQNEAAWFQYGGNTYIVADLDGDTTYTDATDFTVMLTGLVDLSTASFNTTTDTLEIA